MLCCPVEDNHWTTQYLATRHKFSFQPVTGLTNNPLKKQQDNDGLILSFMISAVVAVAHTDNLISWNSKIKFHLDFILHRNSEFF